MTERRLQAKLNDYERALRSARMWHSLALCWAGAAILGAALLLIEWLAGEQFDILPLLMLAAAIIAAVIVMARLKKRSSDLQELIATMEPEQPELRNLLSAAAEQKPDRDSGDFSFLQLRVIDEVLKHPRQELWWKNLEKKLSAAQSNHSAAFISFVVVLMVLGHGFAARAHRHGVFSSLMADEITVTPGDTKVERGTGLVISARFGGKLPAEATLVLNSASGKNKSLPMSRNLADPVFGASLPEISEEGVYHIEYGAKKTRDYRISVFDYPALVRADADLRYPAYTGLTNKTIRDTRRISAVEGTHLSLMLQLNKPVASARFVGQEKALALAVQSNAVALLPDFALTNSAHYTLELVDAEGRTNKFPTDFYLQALENHPATVKLVFPRGDQRVSKLEELQLRAEASDDFGLLKYGIGFEVAGQEPQMIELGQTAPANEKRQFGHLISMEKLGVDVDQLVAYFAWADDYGPDGKERRAYSDMFFAEMRPFEEIFRADQSGAGGQNSSQNANQGGGNQSVRLADLQKQIVSATWKLQRESASTAAPKKP
jgi:hypothetical protein